MATIDVTPIPKTWVQGTPYVVTETKYSEIPKTKVWTLLFYSVVAATGGIVYGLFGYIYTLIAMFVFCYGVDCYFKLTQKVVKSGAPKLQATSTPEFRKSSEDKVKQKEDIDNCLKAINREIDGEITLDDLDHIDLDFIPQNLVGKVKNLIYKVQKYRS